MSGRRSCSGSIRLPVSFHGDDGDGMRETGADCDACCFCCCSTCCPIGGNGASVGMLAVRCIGRLRR